MDSCAVRVSQETSQFNPDWLPFLGLYEALGQQDFIAPANLVPANPCIPHPVSNR